MKIQILCSIFTLKFLMTYVLVKNVFTKQHKYRLLVWIPWFSAENGKKQPSNCH